MNPSGKCSQERLTRGTVTSKMRGAAHPSDAVLALVIRQSNTNLSQGELHEILDTYFKEAVSALSDVKILSSQVRVGISI